MLIKILGATLMKVALFYIENMWILVFFCIVIMLFLCYYIYRR